MNVQTHGYVFSDTPALTPKPEARAECTGTQTVPDDGMTEGRLGARQPGSVLVAHGQSIEQELAVQVGAFVNHRMGIRRALEVEQVGDVAAVFARPGGGDDAIAVSWNRSAWISFCSRRTGQAPRLAALS